MAKKSAPAATGIASADLVERPLTGSELARLTGLGIHPASLAGRLRLVLTIGCYRDFRFTRDILLTSAAREQVDPAVQALMDLGAHCDCEVLRALGQPARGLLWHNRGRPVRVGEEQAWPEVAST